MSRTRRLSPCLLALLLLLGAAGPALAADEMPVPAKFQAVLFKRIFAYERVLADCDGSISEAARRLGLHRKSLQRKLGKYAPK